MDGPLNLREQHYLIVGGKAHAAQTLRMALSVAGLCHVSLVANSDAAIELLRSERFGAVFCDEHAKPVGGKPFYFAARRQSGLMDPMIPLFLVCTAPKRRFIEDVRDRGVTDVIARPVRPATILRKLCTAFEAPRPFIRAGEFFGPDRRAMKRPAYIGRERRAGDLSADDADTILV